MMSKVITGVKQCPECKSLNIKGSAWRGDGNYVEIEYTCQNCGTEFLYVNNE